MDANETFLFIWLKKRVRHSSLFFWVWTLWFLVNICCKCPVLGKGAHKYFQSTDVYLPSLFEISDKIVNRSGSMLACMLLPFISLALNIYLRKVVYKKHSCQTALKLHFITMYPHCKEWNPETIWRIRTQVFETSLPFPCHNSSTGSIVFFISPGAPETVERSS